jgi:hypothetical protein
MGSEPGMKGISRLASIVVITVIIISVAFVVYVASSPSNQSATTTVVSTATTTMTSTIVENQASLDALAARVSQLSNQVSLMQSAISELNTNLQSQNAVIQSLQNQIYLVQIPYIVKEQVNTSGIAGSMLSPVTNFIKGQIPCPECYALYPVVDAASSAIQGTLQSKIKVDDLRIVSTSPVSQGVYSANIILRLPLRLGQIPGLSAVVAVMGDITLYIYVPATVQVNVLTQTVSSYNFDTSGITVGL